jgi:hypothetical protein
VAEADYDCRPPGVRPTASEPKTNRFFAASAILHSSPDPSSLALAALPDDAVLAFNARAFSPDGNCATRSHRRRVPHERKKCSGSKPSLSVDLHHRSGTYVEQLDYLDGARAVCHPFAVYAEPRAQGQPFRDLIRV